MENKRTRSYGSKRKIRTSDNSEFDFDAVKESTTDIDTVVPSVYWSDKYKNTKVDEFKAPLPGHSSCHIPAKKMKVPLKDNMNKLPKINHLEEICSRTSRTKLPTKTKLSAKVGNGSFDFRDDGNDKRIGIPSKRPLKAESPAKYQKMVTSKSTFDFPSEAKEKQIQEKSTAILKPGPKKAKLNMKAIRAGKSNSKGFGGIFEMPDEDGIIVIKEISKDKDKEEEKTMVTNVKDSSNCIRDGESQKFFDEFDYLFDGIRTTEPIAVRILSVFNIAKSCFSIDFRGNIRKNKLLNAIYKELSDAADDASLALCASAFMYIISIDDKLQDFPQPAIDIILKILKSDEPTADKPGSPRKPTKSYINFRRKISTLFKNELSSMDVFDLDNLSSSEMVHEVLIFITAPTADVDFRAYIRTMGGIDYFILKMEYLLLSIDKASKYCVSDSKLTPEISCKLNRIERCLQILENLTYMNSDNQNYLLNFKSKTVVKCLHKTLNTCLSIIHSNQSKKIKLLSRSKQNDKVFECLIATMRMMLNLTHSNEYCCCEIGKYDGMMRTVLENILFLPKLASDKHKFDCYTLGLGLLINVLGEVPENRKILAKCSFDESVWFNYDAEQAVFDQGKNPIELLCATFLRFHASSNELEKQTFIEAENLCLKEANEKEDTTIIDNTNEGGDKDVKDSKENSDIEKEIEQEVEKADIEKMEEEEEDGDAFQTRSQNSASASQKTEKSNGSDPFDFKEPLPPGKKKNTEETNITKKIKVKEVVDNMIAKAGEHMEESMIGSYLALLIGILTKDEENLEVITKNLPEPKVLIDVLKKFLQFMNMMSLTSAAASKSGMQQIRSIVHWLSAVL